MEIIAIEVKLHLKEGVGQVNLTDVRSESNWTSFKWKGFVLKVWILSGNSIELHKIQTYSGNYIDTDKDVKFHRKGGFCSKSLNTSDLFHTALGYWILDSAVQT